MSDSIEACTNAAVSMVDGMSVLSPSDAAKLNAEINASAFASGHKVRIAEAVLRKLATASANGVAAASEASGKQSFMFPERYLAQSDIDYAMDLSKTTDQVALRFRSRFR